MSREENWTAICVLPVLQGIPTHTTSQNIALLEPLKVQFSTVAQSCPTICNPMDCSTPGFRVHLLAQTWSFFTPVPFHITAWEFLLPCFLWWYYSDWFSFLATLHTIPLSLSLIFSPIIWSFPELNLAYFHFVLSPMRIWCISVISIIHFGHRT